VLLCQVWAWGSPSHGAIISLSMADFAALPTGGGVLRGVEPLKSYASPASVHRLPRDLLYRQFTPSRSNSRAPDTRSAWMRGR
jgi:hypothetical protein